MSTPFTSSLSISTSLQIIYRLHFKFWVTLRVCSQGRSYVIKVELIFPFLFERFLFPDSWLIGEIFNKVSVITKKV